MGFITDPDEYPYAVAPNTCDFCYDAGKTPSVLFLCLAGITIGDLWTPADPPPPNGFWRMDVAGSCWWQGVIDGITYNYQSNAPGSLISAGVPATYWMFNAAGASCLKWAVNQWQDPAATLYCGGWATIANPCLEDTLTIPDVMELVNIEPGPDVNVDPMPMETDQTVYRFTDVRDHTNILFKLDNS